MKSHNDMIQLVLAVLQDCERTVASYSHKRDMKTVVSRVKHEGLSFLTITLPDFGKDFFKSLSSGFIDPKSFRSFKRTGAIPAFLQGMTDQVFDKWNGRIFDEPCVASIKNIRQICLMFKKLKMQCTDKRNCDALTRFEEDEAIFNDALNDLDISKFVKCSGILWGPFAKYISCGTSEDLLCKHGPGGTAEGHSGNRKYLFSRYHERLEPYFPLVSTCFHNESAYDSKEVQAVELVSSEHEQPVKVHLVPKTLKTPRIIAIEPVCMQFAQQGLSSKLVKSLEEYTLTKGHINFKDQSVNSELALKASRDGSYATLDLSSASDRVPFDLAMRMFDWSPEFSDSISACRSLNAKLPNGKIIPLKKFASMGSALCFPIEAMYFYTICIIALLEEQCLPYTHRNVLKVSRRVFIYGDDIIVPTHAATYVSDTLQKYYCKVGTAKSFWTGKFRESCGMDAYDGIDVTPVYIRYLRPGSISDSSAIISLTSACNSLYRQGLWLSSNLIKDWIERLVGKLPITLDGCSGLGLSSFQRRFSIDRWSKRWQRPEVRTYVPGKVYRKDKLNGLHALMKSLLQLNCSNPSWFNPSTSDELHLERTERRGTVVLKRRWVDPSLTGHESL